MRRKLSFDDEKDLVLLGKMHFLLKQNKNFKTA